MDINFKNAVIYSPLEEPFRTASKATFTCQKTSWKTISKLGKTTLFNCRNIFFNPFFTESNRATTTSNLSCSIQQIKTLMMQITIEYLPETLLRYE